MSSVLECSCGAKVRVDPSKAGARLRCPKCKGDILTGAGGAAVVVAAAKVETGAATCPICQCGVAPDEQVVRCPACEQVHHTECWSSVGGCSTYGCKHAPAADKAAAEAPRSAWGDEKKCPACGETIKAIAVRCRYCGTDFDTVDPLTLRDLKRKEARREEMEGFRKWVVAYGVVSLFGCLAPLMLIIGGFWLLPRREYLKKVGGFHQVVAYAGLVVSLVYSILMLMFWLFGNRLTGGDA